MALNQRYKNRMSDYFTDQNIMDKWLEVERAVLVAKHRANPDDMELADASRALSAIKSSDAQRAKELEKITKHDLVAFVRSVAEQVDAANPGQNLGRFVHQGITSYDTEDTAQSLMLSEAGHAAAESLRRMTGAAAKRSRIFKYAPANGYTHNQIAEPVTIGKRFADFEILARGQIERFDAEVRAVRLCKIKGAVGISGGLLTPELERSVADLLNMRPAPVATQILPIENLAQFFGPFAIIAGIVENFAQNLRLASGDLAEMKEGFAKGQTGSSIMTFKQNPINIENITGAARKIKALYAELLNATGTWRERDISNSFQIQRHIIPEMFETMEHIAKKTAGIIDGLQVFPIQSYRNLAKYGDFIFAGAAKEFFAANQDASIYKQGQIYDLIQEKSIAAKYAADFRGEEIRLFDSLASLIGNDSIEELRKVLSLPYNLRNVRAYYELAYGGAAADSPDHGIHHEMVDYIIETGQLAHFKRDDAAAFMLAYGQIAEANYAGERSFEDEKEELASASSRFMKELGK